MSAHLQRLDTNETAELRELRGVAADDLDGALREMEAVASGARSARHFYHASINVRADEVMTAEQWQQAVDRLERELELTDQPRAVVAHVKEGRAHVHVVWSRIDLETLKAIPDSHNFRRHEIVSRELEQEFGHARVQGAHIDREGERPDRTPSHAEMQQAERSGLDPKEAKAQLTAIWNRTDSGKAFAAAIEEEGWALARGDKRDFVVLDRAGETHSLARRIEGAKAKDVRARMDDIDAGSLPSVEQAKEIQRARLQAQSDARAGEGDQPEPAPMPVTAKPSEETGSGGMSDKQPVDEATRRVQEEAAREVTRRQQKQAQQQIAAQQGTTQAEQQRLEDMARENADHQVRQVEEMREQRARLDRFEAEQKRQAEEVQQETERRREADARGQQAEGEIRDAGDRYRIALGQHYDVQNPYGSLARAAMSEYGAFIQDRERLNAELAREQDPEARKALELRRDIEANDYMAITSQRIVAQSEIITGRSDSDEAVLFRERAAQHKEQSQELRQQYRNLAAERAARETAQREDDHQQKQGREQEDARKGKEAVAQPDTAHPAKEMTDQDHERLGKGEMTDAKAERIARIREQGRAFESSEKERQNSQGQDRGDRSR